MNGVLINAPALKLTPTTSPSARTPVLRSPTKASRDEHSLSLREVIGATVTSSVAFDCLEKESTFAFTAGSAAVVVTVGDDLQVKKTFFRARPNTNSLPSSTSTYESPSIAASQNRRRTVAPLRDAPLNSLPFGSPHNDSADSPLNRLGNSKERIKAATCVSLSPDGLLLAVGETGYKPRVLIFSTTRAASTDSPLTVISEHTFGVRCLAFSEDSQYLATLGDMNDGFLFIWSISRNGSATLHASNKCTSNIKQIAWLGNSLITVGTRHVKIWRIEAKQKTSPTKRVSDASFAFPSPSSFSSPSKALSGRNCLLGPLLDKTFTAVIAVALKQAIVCDEEGDVCLLDDTNPVPEFYKVAAAGFAINAVTVWHEKLILVAGYKGQIKGFSVEKLLSSMPSTVVEGLSSNDFFSGDDADVLAMASIGRRLVCFNANRNIQLLEISDDDRVPKMALVHRLPAHGGPVQGVKPVFKPNSFDAVFYTWSSEGLILFWSSDVLLRTSITVPLEQLYNGDGFLNELKTVRLCSNSDFLITGDKFGVLRVINMKLKECVNDTKAHSSEITDIAVHSTTEHIILASSGRDRMVQLFKKKADGLDLVQTLDEHIGAVTGLLFARDGQLLISCSSDRTLVVRERVTGAFQGQTATAYLAARTITLKATPLSMDLHLDQEMVIVSTIDRNFHVYNMQSGACASSFKTSDSEGGDAVILAPIVQIPRSKKSILLAGVSGTDKSLRIYDDSGRLLCREYGHTEGMTGVTVFDDGEGSKNSLVTVATDGTIFIWSLSSEADQLQEMLEALELGQSGAAMPCALARPPLRRVLSSFELSQLREEQEENSVSPVMSPLPRSTIRKKTSRLSMAPTPKLEPSSQAGRRKTINDSTGRRISRTRSPSPSTPRLAQSIRGAQPIINTVAPLWASTEPPNVDCKEGNSNRSIPLATSTEHICKALHTYRKKLSHRAETLPLEHVRQLERELTLTARCLAEKAARADTVMERFLDQYSERLVGLLEGRIEESIAKRVEGMGSTNWNGVKEEKGDEMIYGGVNKTTSECQALEII